MLKYKVMHRLGAGGMGEVFLGQDIETGRQVAIKILLSQYSQSSESRERFLREMKVCAALEHPHIIRVYDYGQSNGTLYFVMQHIEGESLKEVIAQGALDVHDAVDLIENVADALAYIHPRDLIHRDLKPANIMRTKTGEAILLDFGLVKALAEVSLTTTGKVIGTPRYMAPEMMLTGKVDIRSDIYQLGCIFYELATGQHAVPGKTRKEVAERSLYEVPKPPGEVRSEIDQDLSNLIMNTLEKNPDERYQSAGAMLEDLRAYKAGKGVKLQGSGRAARERPAPRRRRPRKPTASTAAVSGPKSSGTTKKSGALPAGPGSVGHSVSATLSCPPSRSISTQGTMGMDTLHAPSQALRVAGPMTSDEVAGASQKGKQAAGLAALLCGLGLLAVVVFAFSGPSYVVQNLEVEPVYAGVNLSWQSRKAYPSRVEVWNPGGAVRVVENPDATGLLHRVQVRGLDPGTEARFRVLLPDGEPVDGREFIPLDVSPSEPELAWLGPFRREVRLDLGTAPAILLASRGGKPLPHSSEELRRHEVAVDLPRDGTGVLIRLEVDRGEGQRALVRTDLSVPGVREEVVAAFSAPSGQRQAKWQSLITPLKAFMAASEPDAAVKMSIYESLTSRRDRFAAQGSGPDPASGLAANFRVHHKVTDSKAFSARLEAPLIAIADQFTTASKARVAVLSTGIQGFPPSAAAARRVALGITFGHVPSVPAVLRVDLNRIGRLNFYFGPYGDKSGVSGDPNLGAEWLHEFDPRMLRGLSDLPLVVRLESLTGEALPKRESLILKGIALHVQY